MVPSVRVPCKLLECRKNKEVVRNKRRGRVSGEGKNELFFVPEAGADDVVTERTVVKVVGFPGFIATRPKWIAKPLKRSQHDT